VKKEDLFRAIGEVKDAQVLEAARIRPAFHWQPYAAAAACFLLILSAAISLPLRAGQNSAGSSAAGSDNGFGYIEDAVNDSAADDSENFADGGSDMDGSDSAYDDAGEYRYYSKNVEIGQLDQAPTENASPAPGDSSASLVPLSAAEIFAMDTDIFRGSVEDLYYYVTEGSYTHYCTVAKITVTQVYRGDLSEGEVCTVYLPFVPGLFSTSTAGMLTELSIGQEGIFMPHAATEDTGVENDDGFFCYADVADYYFTDGLRFLFLDTGEQLLFHQSTYPDLADSESLDDAGAYVEKMLSLSPTPLIGTN